VNYESIRDEIENQLNSVEGIGRVFKSRRNQGDMPTFLSRFKTSDDLINVCWFTKATGNELTSTGIGSTDEADEILATQIDEQWEIEVHYGFRDDDVNPSEFDFEILAERIENKFRFLQNLNGKVDKSFPLSVLIKNYAQFGDVFCHHVVWRLPLRQRPINQ
jgi:hypothetical protein